MATSEIAPPGDTDWHAAHAGWVLVHWAEYPSYAAMLAPKADVMIGVGEASGDAYAGAILGQLQAMVAATHRAAGRSSTDHPLVCAAMGGDALKAAGAEIEHSIDGLGIVGFLPVLARFPEFLGLLNQMAGIARARRPRVVLTIDYPGFNLRLHKRLQPLRQSGTRLVHVVAPQVWAWKPRRAKTIAHLVDRLLCFFPFEPSLFNRFVPGMASFVGHPLVDLVDQVPDTAVIDGELGLRPNDRLLVLAPGSREKEVASLLPRFLEAWSLVEPLLRARGESVQVAIARSPHLPLASYRAHTSLPVIEGQYRALCARAHFGLIASGTATLEAALMGLPHIIAYDGDPVSLRVMRHLIVTEHIGLPNIIHQARVCPEMIGHQAHPERLAERLLRLWAGRERDAMVHTLATTRDRLGGGGALTRVTRVIADEFTRGKRRTETIGGQVVPPEDRMQTRSEPDTDHHIDIS